MRRGILSMVSSLYDPLGLVSPFTLPVKLVLQSLCKRGLKWDEPIPDKESREYRKWIKKHRFPGEYQSSKMFKESTSSGC